MTPYKETPLQENLSLSSPHTTYTCLHTYTQVTQALSWHQQLLNHSQLLQSLTHNLSLAADTQNTDSSPESQLINTFTLALADLADLCTQLLNGSEVNDNEVGLPGECADLLSSLEGGGSSGRFIPVVPPSVGELGGRFNSTHTLVQRLVEILSDGVFAGPAGPVDIRLTYYSMMVSVVTSDLCTVTFALMVF